MFERGSAWSIGSLNAGIVGNDLQLSSLSEDAEYASGFCDEFDRCVGGFL